METREINMIETLMLVLVCLSFSVVSIACAFSFAMNAYLDWQEQHVAIEYGIRVITQRNTEEGTPDDDTTD
tara:strand:- start:724 stop:936 length:213 start_codon:yes stop_codon:yes gene_type:complete